MSNFHLQEIQSLQNSLRERQEYVTELENRLRALWDKYDGDLKHYMDRIKRLEGHIEYLESVGDSLFNGLSRIEAEQRWNKAKEAKP